MKEEIQRVMINTNEPLADSLWVSNPLTQTKIVDILNAFEKKQLPKDYKFKNPKMLTLFCTVVHARTLERIEYFGKLEYRRQGDDFIFISPL